MRLCSGGSRIFQWGTYSKSEGANLFACFFLSRKLLQIEKYWIERGIRPYPLILWIQQKPERGITCLMERCIGKGTKTNSATMHFSENLLFRNMFFVFLIKNYGLFCLHNFHPL